MRSTSWKSLRVGLGVLPAASLPAEDLPLEAIWSKKWKSLANSVFRSAGVAGDKQGMAGGVSRGIMEGEDVEF